MEKVKVISTVGHAVHVLDRELSFDRTWRAKGQTILIDKEKLEDLMMANIGFRNMIASGMLYIEDMEVKKELGIEPEDTSEPVNVIVLSDKDKRMYLTTLSLVGFKDKIKKLSHSQLEELCNYAVDNKLIDIDKAKVLKEACGLDVIRMVTLKEQAQEA